MIKSGLVRITMLLHDLKLPATGRKNTLHTILFGFGPHQKTTTPTRNEWMQAAGEAK